MGDDDSPGSLADRQAIDLALTAIGERARREAGGRVGDAVAYALAGGGKRIRGLMVLAAYRACDGASDAAGLAAAVEVVHAYSLVHDDLPCMDDDDMRRGRSTVHRAFDVPTATVVGLTMIPLAAASAFRAATALGLRAEDGCEIVRQLMGASGAAGMVGGQLLDLDFEGREASPDDLERIHRAKTGALMECSVVIGAMGARASMARRAVLARFGAQVGLAFQIADDLLDVTATTAQLGKTAGRDAQRLKSTYPALLGIEPARARARSLVDGACEELEEVGVAGDQLKRLANYAVQRTS
jgi:geranylgeranyl pyrophosphate synthase